MKTILKSVSKSFKNLFRFAQLWPEVFSVPIALLVWFASPYLIWMVDEQAATFDTGILQIIVYVIVAITAFNGVVFMGIKFNFPVVYEFYKGAAGESFNKLTDWQKICVLLILFIGLFFCCVWLAHIMVQPTQLPTA